MKSRDRRKLEIPPGGREAADLLINYISDRSVAMLLNPARGALDIGSATCVRIEDHYLLATAAHNIDYIFNDSGIRLLPYGRNDHPGIAFLSRSHPRTQPFDKDVAWVELRGEEVLSNSLKSFGLEDLRCRQDPDPFMPFFLQGYPAAEVEIEGEVVSPLSLGLMTVSVEPPEGEEFAVEYPPQSEEDIGLELTNPKGISGGGVWLESRFRDNLIWAPERAKLVAIATTWNQGAARLSAVRVEHWLDLVSRDFPDLQSVIRPLLETP